MRIQTKCQLFWENGCLGPWRMTPSFLKRPSLDPTILRNYHPVSNFAFCWDSGQTAVIDNLGKWIIETVSGLILVWTNHWLCLMMVLAVLGWCWHIHPWAPWSFSSFQYFQLAVMVKTWGHPFYDGYLPFFVASPRQCDWWV